MKEHTCILMSHEFLGISRTIEGNLSYAPVNASATGISAGDLALVLLTLMLPNQM